MDLSLSKNLNHERRPIDEENSREPTNAVPNFTWNSLNWSDDDNILLFTLQILGSQWQNKMHDRGVNSTNNNMILEFR
mgnify:FL=1